METEDMEQTTADSNAERDELSNPSIPETIGEPRLPEDYSAIEVLDLDEEEGWMEEVDSWISELISELHSADSEEQRRELYRKAVLLNSLSDAAWRLAGLN